MSVERKQFCLDISGLGIIFYSPEAASHISDGEDYLSTNYWTEKQVQSHIQQGSIVGFGTSTPGTFFLSFHDGNPKNQELLNAEFKLRLGIQCVGGLICFRDLYDLLDWKADCPKEQTVQLDDGSYHMTLLSHRPDSGVLGDKQKIQVFLQKLESFPALSTQGIPTLC